MQAFHRSIINPMKTEQEHIEYIRNAFQKMQTIDDLLQIMNYAKKIVYGEKFHPFTLKQIIGYSNPLKRNKSYKSFTIKKKSGKDRTIYAPQKGLKAIQKVLNFIIQCMYQPHHAAYGFVQNKSIVDNANLHIGKRYVYNIDLKDFFSSIDQARVWACFKLPPFNLNGANPVYAKNMNWKDFKSNVIGSDEPLKIYRKNGRSFTKTPIGTLFVAKNFDKDKERHIIFGDENTKTIKGKSLEGTMWLSNTIPYTSNLDICNILASICCTEMEVERKNANGEWENIRKNVLPQGAPTSPTITNIICQRLDFILTGVAKRFGLTYSRYADDITFSSMHNVFQTGSDFLNELHRVIADQNFDIKESKTRLQKDGYKKEVTGLIVNEKANVQKKYIKQLRMWLYYWETYGYNKASHFFKKQYIEEKGASNVTMENVIGGKLEYLKMVKGSENNVYKALHSRFIFLTGENNAIDSLLDIWEKQGISKALDFFQNIKQKNSYEKREI